MRIHIITLLFLAVFVSSTRAQDTNLAVESKVPVFKRITLLDFKKKHARAVSFCPASRDLFVSFDQEILDRWNVDTGQKFASYAAPKGKPMR